MYTVFVLAAEVFIVDHDEEAEVATVRSTVPHSDGTFRAGGTDLELGRAYPVSFGPPFKFKGEDPPMLVHLKGSLTLGRIITPQDALPRVCGMIPNLQRPPIGPAVTIAGAADYPYRISRETQDGGREELTVRTALWMVVGRHFAQSIVRDEREGMEGQWTYFDNGIGEGPLAVEGGVWGTVFEAFAKLRDAQHPY